MNTQTHYPVKAIWAPHVYGVLRVHDNSLKEGLSSETDEANQVYLYKTTVRSKEERTIDFVFLAMRKKSCLFIKAREYRHVDMPREGVKN